MTTMKLKGIRPYKICIAMNHCYARRKHANHYERVWHEMFDQLKREVINHPDGRHTAEFSRRVIRALPSNNMKTIPQFEFQWSEPFNLVPKSTIDG